MTIAHSTSLEYNRDNSEDLVWNSSTESYTSPKPENLYAWTNGTTTIYTTSQTPSASDSYYDVNGNTYGQYDLTINDISLLGYIYSYDSTNNLIKIGGDPA